MKSFQEFLMESSCNKTGKDVDCPIHGNLQCPSFKSTKSIEEIAKKHNVDISVIEKQLKMGSKVELEHTKNKSLAKNIALQHLDELPDYYTRLKKVEKIKEERKSGDYSLHDWFSKSKSSDGKPGWVQLGGPYSGKPCARQPGQESTPKCGSSKMKRNLSKEEEERAFRRKNRKDSDQPKKDNAAKPTYVATEEIILEKKDSCYYKVKSRYKVWPSAYASGALVKCRKKGSKNWGTKTEEYTRIQTRGTTYDIMLSWRGKIIFIQIFFPQFNKPPRDQVSNEIKKIYPGAILLNYKPSTLDPTKPLFFSGDSNGSR